jgi:hypothetical protein
VVHRRVRERVVAVEGEVDGHTLLAQTAGDRLGQALMIFDDEHTHRHSMPPGGHSQVTAGVTAVAPATAYNRVMNPHHQPLRASGAICVAVLAALLVSACGGAARPPRSGSSGPAGSGSGVRTAYRYADCMRSHGVSAIQDPHVSSNGNSTSVAFHVDPQITGSPDFKSAQRACAHILPGLTGNGPTPAQTHAREQDFIAFSKCMREHGFPRFPDPNGQGQLTPAMLSAAGIDLRQPAIRTAAYGCLPASHGLVTKADVNQAIADPTGGSQTSSTGG